MSSSTTSSDGRATASALGSAMELSGLGGEMEAHARPCTLEGADPDGPAMEDRHLPDRVDAQAEAVLLRRAERIEEAFPQELLAHAGSIVGDLDKDAGALLAARDARRDRDRAPVPHRRERVLDRAGEGLTQQEGVAPDRRDLRVALDDVHVSRRIGEPRVGERVGEDLVEIDLEFDDDAPVVAAQVSRETA